MDEYCYVHFPPFTLSRSRILYKGLESDLGDWLADNEHTIIFDAANLAASPGGLMLTVKGTHDIIRVSKEAAVELALLMPRIIKDVVLAD